jgi:hypothetical protein
LRHARPGPAFGEGIHGWHLDRALSGKREEYGGHDTIGVRIRWRHKVVDHFLHILSTGLTVPSFPIRAMVRKTGGTNKRDAGKKDANHLYIDDSRHIVSAKRPPHKIWLAAGICE